MPLLRILRGDASSTRNPESGVLDNDPQGDATVIPAEVVQLVIQSHGLCSQDEVEEVRQKALAQGVAQGKKSSEDLRQKYIEAISELATLREKTFAATEHDLVALALHIAEQVLATDQEGRRAFTVRMAQHALGLLKEADSITLRVGSADMAALKEQRPELFHDKATIKAIEDPSISHGGVVAESNLGRVDATIHRRLEEAAQLLLGSPVTTGETLSTPMAETEPHS